MKYIFIINPVSGAGNAEELIRSAVEALPEKEQCEIYVTKGVGDATEYVRGVCENCRDEELRFIACGGDGTINEVFSGAVARRTCLSPAIPAGAATTLSSASAGRRPFWTFPLCSTRRNSLWTC